MAATTMNSTTEIHDLKTHPKGLYVLLPPRCGSASASTRCWRCSRFICAIRTKVLAGPPHEATDALRQLPDVCLREPAHRGLDRRQDHSVTAKP